MMISIKSMSAVLASTVVAAAITLPVISATALAGEEAGVKLGVLTCKKLPDTSHYYIVHSSVAVNCVFSHPQGKEHYTGRAGIALGLDLNWKHTEDMAYLVIGGSSDVRPSARGLAGTYVGGRASATVGVGAGIAILVGGGEKNISLQPLALEVNSGVGAAAGIGYLSLEQGDGA